MIYLFFPFRLNKVFFINLLNLVSYSQVFIMRWSLDVLNVWLWLNFDASIRELSSGDWVLPFRHLLLASPVPWLSSLPFHSGDFFVSQISNDLEHWSTVTIFTINLVEEGWLHIEVPCNGLEYNKWAQSIPGIVDIS